MSAQGWITVARVVRPQGRKGEVLCELLTDFPERFAAGARVFLAGPDAHAESEDGEPSAATVTSSWLAQGKNRGRIVLGFAEVASIDEAERLAGREVLVPESERRELEEGVVYVNDLCGCTLFDHGNAVGEIRDVNFATTPDGKQRLEEASPLLVVDDPSGREVLIPFVEAWIVRIDLPGRRVEMLLPEGLIDVQAD